MTMETEPQLTATTPKTRPKVHVGTFYNEPLEINLRHAAVMAHLANLRAALPVPAIDNPCITYQELHRLLKLHQPDIIDLDTEFAGRTHGMWDADFDIRTESCCQRVAPFLISLAFQGCEDGLVFEPTPDHLRILKAYLAKYDPLVCAHNAPVDVHATEHETIQLHMPKVLDTLQAAKWFFPSYESFGLDALHRHDFPELPAKRLSFADVFNFDVPLAWDFIASEEKEVKICACGVAGCRKTKGEGHTKTLTTVFVDKPLKKSKVMQGTMTVDDLQLDEQVYWNFCLYAKEDAAMLHRWRTKMLWPKVNLKARAAPPKEVRFL